MFSLSEKQNPFGARGVVIARMLGWKTSAVLTVLLMHACSSKTSDQSASIRRATSPNGAAGATQGAAGSRVIERPSEVKNPSGLVAGSGANVAQSPPVAAASPTTSATNTAERSRQSVAIDECPGGLDASVVTALQAADLQPSGRWLYPYDRTVFPRGLLAPVLQWDGLVGAAIYLRMRSKSFDYKGCFAAGAAANLPIPQAAWDTAGAQSDGKNDPLQIELTLSASGKTQRLPPLTLIFALANVKSAIYYNTYGSTIASNKGIIGGVVMRILPGQAQPDVFVTVPAQNGDCIGCHAVSVSGNRMIAETHAVLGTAEGTSTSFDLTSTSGGASPPVKGMLKRAGFAALTPDGSKFVIQGAATDNFTGPIASDRTVTNVPGSFGPQTSSLYDTDTGNEISDSGIVPYPYMPMFSVDGKLIVFNHVDASDSMTGHTLAVMDFDAQTNKFSNLRPVYQSEVRFPGWPFFLPDVARDSQGGGSQTGRRVVFALGECDFATSGLSATPHQSDLWWLDIDSAVSAPLATANGDGANGMTYLPYAQRDPHLNFFPTVSPVAAGGYFWLFFTSKRNYGNLLVTDSPDNHPEAKKIWVSAIDIDAAAGSDPSHPAFLLPGQELDSGNARAFASLEACRAEGASCASGIDCCCGFCSENKCECKLKPSCAKLEEKCSSAADCCDKNLACIGGFCGEVILQ